jgi:ubiquinone/menaquinone biosynthesis C-methylase UbiE
MITNFLKKNYKLENSIYTKKFNSVGQNKEFKLRTNVGLRNYKNYFYEISKYHSIEVMDREIIKFTKKLKKNSIVLDLGCGWCWHWRNINKIRPDIKIVAIDFVKENFEHAKNILTKNSLRQFYFINDNIYNIKFNKNLFDAIWTVQTLQHIPNLNNILKKVYIALKPRGIIYNYTLNNSIFVKIKNFIFRNQDIKNYYYLNRNLDRNKYLFAKIFNNKVFVEFNEILFHPELNLFFGKKNSFFSKLDAKLSGYSLLKSYFARQVLIKVMK